MRTLTPALILLSLWNVSCQEVKPAAVKKAWTFETDPMTAGWESGGSYLSQMKDFQGAWAETGGMSGSRCLSIRRGLWQTPAIPVQPLMYYRASFAARAEVSGFYVFRFFDAQGRELASDEYNALETSPNWQTHEVFTQAREDAATMRLAFIPGSASTDQNQTLWIDDVTLARAAAKTLLAWNDRLYRTLPALTWNPPKERWQYLANTRERLQKGGELRVLVLGDSIANDMSNSQFQLLIQRQYPRSKVILLRTIRGGTGCPFYRHNVKDYVVAKAPDLVIIAGISHGHDADAIRDVIEQTRRLAERPVEFLVMTGAIREPGLDIFWSGKRADSPPPMEIYREALEKERVFYAKLTAFGNELGIATLDMRTIWESYLAGSDKSRSWYQRDVVHANARGKQILGRVMERFFAP